MPTEADYNPQASGDLLLIRASTLNQIYALLKRQRVKTPEGSGLSATEDSSGTSLRTTSTNGGSTGGGLGPVVFAGTASGEIAYFLVNGDGKAYSTPPTKPDGTPYPIANPP